MQVGISLRNATLIRKNINFERPYLLSVENPLNPSLDVGANSYDIMRVKHAFEVALARLTFPGNDPLLARILPVTDPIYMNRITPQITFKFQHTPTNDAVVLDSIAPHSGAKKRKSTALDQVVDPAIATRPRAETPERLKKRVKKHFRLHSDSSIEVIDVDALEESLQKIPNSKAAKAEKLRQAEQERERKAISKISATEKVSLKTKGKATQAANMKLLQQSRK